MTEDLRERLERILQQIPRDELLTRSAEACRRLTETSEYRKSETIMVFLSMPHEVDTTPLVLDLWQHRKRVLAPKIVWADRRLLPIEIHTLHQDITDSPMPNLREPIGGPTVAVAEIDMVIVPGLGFDARGNRLGRGVGFYERFLNHRDYRAVSCALALEEQFVAEVPTEPLDHCVDMLVTDRKVRRFKTVAHK